MSRFTITTTAGALGDWMSLTPILRAMRDRGQDPLVIAMDSPHTREFATLYQGLAEVQWAAPGVIPPNTPETNDPDCSFAERILLAHDVTDVSPIPYVEVTMLERMTAISLLGIEVNRELTVFSHTVGGARPDMPDNHMGAYRRMPDELRDRLIERIHSRGQLPVRFGTKVRQSHVYANHEEIPGVLTIPDLSLRQTAACMAVIGRGIFTDTGDHHLMLAVGGTSECWVPPSSWFYQHGHHHYRETAWALEPCRETYTIFPRDLPTIQ